MRRHGPSSCERVTTGPAGTGVRLVTMEMAGPQIGRALVVIVDDRVSGGELSDQTGPLVTELLEEANFLVDGVVSATKPLSYNGTLISDIQMRFEGGRIVDVQASQGRDVLVKAMDSDEGGRRIGEVALVPHSSPISQSGLLFYNTLFDENAASHIAHGHCYSDCFVDGDTITPEEVEKRGGNKSVIHIDWMIGSDKIDIDGIGQDGSVTPVMRKGEWA